MKPGDRVQVPVWSDAWMQGDRYGTIESIMGTRVLAVMVRQPMARVRMDKSGRLLRFAAGNLEVLP